MCLQNIQSNFGSGCWKYRDYCQEQKVSISAVSSYLSWKMWSVLWSLHLFFPYHTQKKRKRMKPVHLQLCVWGFQQKGASYLSVFCRQWIPTGIEIKRLESVCVRLCVPWFFPYVQKYLWFSKKEGWVRGTLNSIEKNCLVQAYLAWEI